MLSKIGSICGLNVVGERLSDPTTLLDKYVRNESNNSESLSKLLQYESYDAENQVFTGSDGSCGFIFEINLKVGQDNSAEKNLKLFLNDELPANGYLQFLVIASNDISVPISIWDNNIDRDSNYRNGNLAVITQMRNYRKEFLLKAANNFRDADNGILARNYRAFICYSVKNSSDIESILKFKQKLCSKLKAEKLSPIDVDAAGLIEISHQILHMQIGHNLKYDPHNDLSDQICGVGNRIKLSEDRIEHESATSDKSNKTCYTSKIFFPKKLPESYSLAEMINLLGSDNRGIPARFIISTTIANNIGASNSAAIINQGNRTLSASEQSYTRHNNTIKKEAAEWRNVMEMHNSGEIFLKENMFLMLTTPNDGENCNSIDIAQEMVKSLWNNQDWQLELATYTQLPLLLNMLPMQQSSMWNILEHFRLYRKALSGEIVARLPVQGEWKGVPKGGMLLLGRRGQLFNWNPFYRIGGGGNFNICMMAPPGSGKSFFLQDLVANMINQNVQVFVMDIGSSFKTLCQSIKGELIGFDSKTKISLNPFAALSNSGAKYAKALALLESGMSKEDVCKHLKIDPKNFNQFRRAGGNGNQKSGSNDEDIEILEIKNEETGNVVCLTKDSYLYAKSLICAMCGVVNSNEGQGLVERIIAKALVKYGEDLDVTKLAEYMRESACDESSGDSMLLTRMYNSIYPYTEQGVHGRFFKSGDAATFKKEMTVFELDAIKDDEPLLSVVLQVILMQITSQFLLGDRSRNFMLIVDEAWRILDYAASFLESFARTVRKYGGSLVICTQDLSSFDNSKGTRKSQAAILECCTWKLIGQQDEDGMASFSKSESYGKYAGLIASVHKHSENKYAEMLISTNQTKVIGRLVTDPFSVAMYSTEREDFNFLEKQEKLGVPVVDAVTKLAVERYGLE